MTKTLLEILLCVSALWLFNGMLIRKIRGWHTTEVEFALLAGVLAGPVWGWIDTSTLVDTRTLLEWSCRFSIALALSSAAIQITQRFVYQYRYSLILLLGVGMPLMALSSTLILHWSLSLSWALAFLVGWIVTPTDPVVAATIVSGERAKRMVPQAMRHAITFESGINDGLAGPLVLLALSIWVGLNSGQSADLMHWLTHVVGYQNLLGGVLSYVLGLGIGVVAERANSASFMVQTTMRPFSLSFTLMVLAAMHLLDMNEILGVFLANLGMAQTTSDETSEAHATVQGTLERLFTIPIFFLLGLLLPWQAWFDAGWWLLIAAVLVVLLRRLPAFLLMRPLMGPFKSLPATAWMGWVGPIGVAALLYSLEVDSQEGFHQPWVIVSLIVCVSVILQGSTALLASQWYYTVTNRRAESAPGRDRPLDTERALASKAQVDAERASVRD